MKLFEKKLYTSFYISGYLLELNIQKNNNLIRIFKKLATREPPKKHLLFTILKQNWPPKNPKNNHWILLPTISRMDVVRSDPQ